MHTKPLRSQESHNALRSFDMSVGNGDNVMEMPTANPIPAITE